MVSFKTATENLAPTLPLTPEQVQLIKQARAFIQQHLTTRPTPAVLVIEGEAGTGKSVVLTHLFNDLQVAARTQPASAVYQTQNRFLVNHPEVLKVYRQLAGTQPHLLKKDFQRPTTMINQLEKHNQQLDVVLIDEAHLLLSKPDHYNNFYHAQSSGGAGNRFPSGPTHEEPLDSPAPAKIAGSIPPPDLTVAKTAAYAGAGFLGRLDQSIY